MGTVPASPMNTGAMEDPMELIKNIVTPIPPELIKAATTPIAGPHAAQVPSNLTTPITPHQDTPMMDTRGIIGHSYGKAVGIANAITGVTNAIGGVVKSEQQHKQNQVRDAAQKLIMTQQSIDEAKQQLDAAHASGDTANAAKFQKLIDDNTVALNGITADPKMRKALAKGFDISYTDPSANKTEEHAAVQEAIKNAKTFQEKRQAAQQVKQQQNATASKNFGEAFAKAQPQGLQPNVAAQQKVAMLQEQQKNQLDSIKALSPYFAAQARAGAAMSIADKKNAIDLRVHAMDNEKDIEKQLLENKQHEQDRAAARSLELLKSSLEMQRKAAEDGNPTSIMKAFQEASKNYLSALDNTQKQRQALNTELDKKPGGSREAEIRRQLTALDSNDTTAKNAFEAGKNFAVKQSGLDPKQFEVTVPVPHVGEGVSGGSSGTSSTSTDDIDPRSGKPFKSSVSTTDRILIKTLSGLSNVYATGASDIDKLKNESEKLGRESDKLLFGDDDESD